MKRVILACLGAVGITLGLAIPAQAFPYGGNTWQIPAQPTITVSDRNGYDLNENEAATNWSNQPLFVDYSMVYTQLETCTYCIIIDTGSVTGYFAVSKSLVKDSSGRYWTRRCQITIDVADVGTYWKARQIAVEHGIGRCLGAADSTAGDSVMNSYNISHPDNIDGRLSSGDTTSANHFFAYPFPTV